MDALLLLFCKFLPSCMVEVKTWWSRLLGRCNTTFVLETLPENDWPWLLKYMGPRSFQIQITDPKMWCAPTKTGVPYNFCLIKFSPIQMFEAAEAGHTLLRTPAPWTLGVETQLWTFPVLRSIPEPNFSSGLDFYRGYSHTRTHTHIDFYILDENKFWNLILIHKLRKPGVNCNNIVKRRAHCTVIVIWWICNCQTLPL